MMYLLFTAVCKIQMSFSLDVNVQRSRSSALNAMLTMCGTSGNASNCREKSDILSQVVNFTEYTAQKRKTSTTVCGYS